MHVGCGCDRIYVMVQSFDQQSSHPQDAWVPVFREEPIGTFRTKDDVSFIERASVGRAAGRDGARFVLTTPDHVQSHAPGPVSRREIIDDACFAAAAD